MSRFHSDSLDKSWVDLFTNNAFVKNINAASLSDILVDQKFPKEIFFSFIHEATHHWTFTSNLGTALFLIKMRGIKSAKASTNTSKETFKIYSDYTRFETIDKLIKPIAEGMALFAEFDSYPSPTEATPTFLVYISMMFSGIKRKDYGSKSISDFEKSYRDFLIERRFLSEEGIRRKTDLLLSPLSLSESPYLTGYLFIKNIQSLLKEKHIELADPNLLLQFIRSYFFNDLGLVALLLDGSINNEEIVPVVMEYFNRMIANLKDLHTGFFHGFEKDILNVDGSGFYKSFASELENETGTRRLLYASAEQFQDQNSWYIWNMRSFFRVTRLKCYIDIKTENVIIYLRLPVSFKKKEMIQKYLVQGVAIERDGYIDVLTGSFPNLETYQPYTGEAVYEKHASLTEIGKKFEIFIFEDRRIFFPFIGLTHPEIEKITNYYATKAHKYSDIDYKEIWGENSFMISEIENFHLKNYDIIYNYLENVSLRCSNKMLPTVKELMKETGFWRILDCREELIRCLTVLSLLSDDSLDSNNSLENVFADQLGEKLPALFTELAKYHLMYFDFKKNKISTDGI